MGHVGLLPQSSNKFKVKGIKLLEQKQILNDAIALSNAGVFAIVGPILAATGTAFAGTFRNEIAAIASMS